MYTITRGPSKLATQRRTGPTQQIDNQINEFKHKQTSWTLPALPAPKIVFTRLSGKKYHQGAQAVQVSSQSQDSFTPAHQENVQFAHHAWQEVTHQLGAGPGPGPHRAQEAVLYKESGQPGPHMDSFVPIDLDEWWAQRFLANIDKQS